MYLFQDNCPILVLETPSFLTFFPTQHLPALTPFSHVYSLSHPIVIGYYIFVCYTTHTLRILIIKTKNITFTLIYVNNQSYFALCYARHFSHPVRASALMRINITDYFYG
jgi:hypothetical protein